MALCALRMERLLTRTYSESGKPQGHVTARMRDHEGVGMEVLSRRRLLRGGAAAGAVTLLSGCGLVSTSGMLGAGDRFPARNIETSIGFEPGGSTDLLGRGLVEVATEELGRAMPVVNKPGANGALAASELTRAPADGHFIGIVNASTVMITPFAVPEREAVHLDELGLVLGTTRDDYVLVAHPSSGIGDVSDLTRLDRTVSYGTTGHGSGAQFAAALLFSGTGIEGADIPFGGDAPAITAILGSQVDVASVQFSAAFEYVSSGELTPLAVFSEERNPRLPDAPTALEQGVEAVVSQYRLVCTPPGVPQDNLDVLVEAFTAAARSDRFLELCEQLVVLPDVYPDEEIRSLVETSRDRYGQQLEEYGIDLRGSS